VRLSCQVLDLAHPQRALAGYFVSTKLVGDFADLSLRCLNLDLLHERLLLNLAHHVGCSTVAAGRCLQD
jgi:hypothetical protein